MIRTDQNCLLVPTELPFGVSVLKLACCPQHEHPELSDEARRLPSH